MLTLTRKGSEVFFGDKKLVINAQASKGPGNEVVKVEGLPGSNGQKWISLSKLVEGDNTFETKKREVTFSSSKTYELTDAEAQEVKLHQDAIDTIIARAKERYIPKVNLKLDPAKMTQDEVEKAIAQLSKYLEAAKK